MLPAMNESASSAQRTPCEDRTAIGIPRPDIRRRTSREGIARHDGRHDHGAQSGKRAVTRPCASVGRARAGNVEHRRGAERDAPQEAREGPSTSTHRAMCRLPAIDANAPDLGTFGLICPRELIRPFGAQLVKQRLGSWSLMMTIDSPLARFSKVRKIVGCLSRGGITRTSSSVVLVGIDVITTGC